MTNIKDIKNKLDNEEENYEAEPIQVNQPEGLSDAFEEFEKETSNIKFDENKKTSGESERQKLEISSEAQKANTSFKIKMFVSFAGFVFAGINTFLLNLIRGTNVPLDDMMLDDMEKESLEPYLNDPAILEFINQIPSGIILACHVEFLFFNKHSEAVKVLREKEKEEKQKEKLNKTQNNAESKDNTSGV